MKCKGCGKDMLSGQEYCSDCANNKSQSASYGCDMSKWPIKILNLETFNIQTTELDIDTVKYPVEQYCLNGFYYGVLKDNTISLFTKEQWDKLMEEARKAAARRNKTNNAGAMIRIIMIVIVIAVLVVSISKCGGDSSNKGNNTTPIESQTDVTEQQNESLIPEVEYEEVPVPEHGAVSHTYDPYSSNTSVLEIELPKEESNSYYYIKLINPVTEETVQSVFMHPGLNAEVYVPCGNFKLRYGSGDKWYGYEHLFGPYGGYSKSDEILEFTNEYGHTITLYPVVNGNFSTDEIPFSEF